MTRVARGWALSAMSMMLLLAVAVPAQAKSTQLVAAASSSWQTNDAVWALAYSKGRIYLGGVFSSVRPPGAALGTEEVARSRLAAFDAATGELVQEFNPGVNGQVWTLNVSPDGNTLYVGGNFTKVKGQDRQRLAALDISTPASVLTPFAPSLNNVVRALSSTATTVYAGGTFTNAGGQPRQRAAAFNTAGGVLPWAPAIDGSVLAMLAMPTSDRVIVGGDFSNVNGIHHRALGSVDATAGTTNMPMDDGIIPSCNGCSQKSVVKSIVTDGTSVYVGAEGTGGGWFDGTVKVDPISGRQIWKDNCLGATQAVAVVNNVLYGGSHAHDCTEVASGVAGGFPQDPVTRGWHHLTAESTTDGTLLPWFPNTNAGPTTPNTVLEVGPRALATDGTQLFVAGHFSTVNGAPQQGFTRFSTGPDTLAPSKPAKPAVTSNDAGEVTVRWTGTSDLDDGTLTYRLYRNNGTNPIYTTPPVSSWFWLPSQFVYRDTALPPGTVYSYRVEAVDEAGNSSGRSTQTLVTVASTSNGGYAAAVLVDAPRLAWRLDETSGSTAADSSGSNRSGRYLGGLAQNQPGVLLGSPAVSLTDGFIAAEGSGAAATSAFSVELWFKTTTRTGGRLIGFGNSQTGTSSSYDRHVYMNDGGQLMFGVYVGRTEVAWSRNAYNDGTWHHMVATQDGAGMSLYVDRVKVATNPTTGAQNFTGYWRVGNDNLNGWPRKPASSAFEGSVDEVAVYGTAVSSARVLQHYTVAD